MSDPWVVQEAGQASQVPPGFYAATFVGVEEIKLKDGSPKWRWAWKVTNGAEAGRLATALTDIGIKPTTLPGVLIAGLLGRPVQPGENVKAAVDGCKGKPYMVSVAPGPKQGKPGVRTVGLPPQM